MVSSNLSLFLSQKQSQNTDQNQIKFGFLTQDTKQRIIVLNASDQMIEKVPIIGLWTYGVNITQQKVNLFNKNILWGLLAEFVQNKTIGEKYFYNQDNFLFISFNYSRNPEFFEVKIKNQNCYYLWFQNQFQYKRDWEFQFREEYCVRNISIPKQIITQISKKSTIILDESIQEERPLKMIPIAQEVDNKTISFAYSNYPQEQISQQHIEQNQFYFLQNQQPQQNYYQKLENQYYQQQQHYKQINVNSRYQKQDHYNNDNNQMGYFVEKLMDQQNQQIIFLQNQVIELQTALFRQNPNHPLVSHLERCKHKEKKSLILSGTLKDEKTFEASDQGNTKNSQVLNQKSQILQDQNCSTQDKTQEKSIMKNTSQINNTENIQKQHSQQTIEAINLNDLQEKEEKILDENISLSKIILPMQNNSQKSNSQKSYISNFQELQNIICGTPDIDKQQKYFENNEYQILEKPDDEFTNSQIHDTLNEKHREIKKDLKSSKSNNDFRSMNSDNEDLNQKVDLKMNMKFLDSVYQPNQYAVEKNQFKSSQSSTEMKNQFKDSIARMPKIKFHFTKDELNSSGEEVIFFIQDDIKELENKYLKIKNLQI